MKILVFVKQVPDGVEMRFHPETKTLIREGMKNGINAYDRRAISQAIRLRDEFGGSVIVATMGPPQAREALLEALFMGADQAFHLQDPALAGSDTLVTARVLASAAQKIGFDLILCGQHSTDSETAQVPAEIAELLQIPFAAAVCRIEISSNAVQATCETDEGTRTIQFNLPALLSAAERLIKPIKTKDADFSSIPADRISNWSIEDLGFAANEVGLKASPTWVADIYEDQIQRNPLTQDGISASLAARLILDVIRSSSKDEPRPVVPPAGGKSKPEFWCLIEFTGNEIRPVSSEMLGFAALLSDWLEGSVSAVCLGQKLNESDVAALSSFGADRIYSASVAGDDQKVELLRGEIATRQPHTFLFPATSNGKILAPRVAARLGLGLTGDCVGFEIDSDNRLVHIKPAFGGNILAPIYSRTSPQLATVRPGALEDMTPRRTAPIPVIDWQAPSIRDSIQTISVQVDAGKQAMKMDNGEIVIGVGMGVGQENVPLVFHLAGLLDAGVGATRRVVDSGWMERQFQVGLTGRFISPRVYLALGIGGRTNHTIGIRKSQKIIAVNNDANAEIFKIADFGFINNSVEVINELIHLLEK